MKGIQDGEICRRQTAEGTVLIGQSDDAEEKQFALLIVQRH